MLSAAENMGCHLFYITVLTMDEVLFCGDLSATALQGFWHGVEFVLLATVTCNLGCGQKYVMDEKM